MGRLFTGRIGKKLVYQTFKIRFLLLFAFLFCTFLPIFKIYGIVTRQLIISLFCISLYFCGFALHTLDSERSMLKCGYCTPDSISLQSILAPVIPTLSQLRDFSIFNYWALFINFIHFVVLL